MARLVRGGLGALGLGIVLVTAVPSGAAGRTAPADILRIKPAQEALGVDYDTPDPAAVASCKLEMIRDHNHLDSRGRPRAVGFLLRDANGKVLRRFIDSHAAERKPGERGSVDQWSYYKDGYEVYRDLASNASGKPDQFRWFNSNGSRWAVDPDPATGRPTAYKRISAPEVSLVAVRAFAAQDYEILKPLLATPEDLKAIGAPPDQIERATTLVQQGPEKFRATLGKLKGWTAETKWVRFDGTMPNLIPADSTRKLKDDVETYENALVFVETGEDKQWLQLPEMIKIGETWKLLAVPQPLDPKAPATALVASFQASAGGQGSSAAGPLSNGDPEVQKLLQQLAGLDKQFEGKTTEEKAQGKYHIQRAALFQQLAVKAPTAREQSDFQRQMIDSLAAAYTADEDPSAGKRLDALLERARQAAPGGDLEAAVAYRKMQADYFRAANDPKNDFAATQKKWLADLAQFIKTYPKATDAPDALLQLAMGQESTFQDEAAAKSYAELVQDYPQAAAAEKARGALKRLNLVGQPMELQGKSVTGGTIDLEQFKGKVVLVSYWATWCDPCKADVPKLRQLYTKYHADGFEIVGVSLDNSKDELGDFLRAERLTWPQVFEPGGLESRPAVQYGIISLPTMILVDRSGKVVQRNIAASKLEAELQKLFNRSSTNLSDRDKEPAPR